MSARIELYVEEVSVDVDLSEGEAARLTPVLKAAFEDLAKRLQAAPVSRFRNPARLALTELRLDAIPTDELLGPRGAARLADAFWERLTSGSTR